MPVACRVHHVDHDIRCSPLAGACYLACDPSPPTAAGTRAGFPLPHRPPAMQQAAMQQAAVRPPVAPHVWYAPGGMVLASCALISWVIPSLLYPLLALCALFWTFLVCLRTTEQSPWRQKMRRKQAATDQAVAAKLAKDLKKQVAKSKTKRK